MISNIVAIAAIAMGIGMIIVSIFKFGIVGTKHIAAAATQMPASAIPVPVFIVYSFDKLLRLPDQYRQ